MIPLFFLGWGGGASFPFSFSFNYLPNLINRIEPLRFCTNIKLHRQSPKYSFLPITLITNIKPFFDLTVYRSHVKALFNVKTLKRTPLYLVFIAWDGCRLKDLSPLQWPLWTVGG